METKLAREGCIPLIAHRMAPVPLLMIIFSVWDTSAMSHRWSLSSVTGGLEQRRGVSFLEHGWGHNR